MNIVFFKTAINNSGGMERVSIFLANELAKDKRNTIYYVSRVRGIPFFPLSDNVKLLYLSDKECENLYLNWLKYICKVICIVRKYHISKWVDVGTNMSLISIPAKFFVKFDVYAWEHFNLTFVWNPITTNLSRWLACRFAKKVIVLTQTDKIRYEEKYQSGNIICIPNPVTIPPINNSVNKDKVVLSIGRLTYQKGYDILLDIWNKAKCKENGWVLEIIGGGELKDEINEKIRCLDLESTVIVKDPSKNINSEYERSQIYLMTSRWEGLPLVLIEAVSASLPIICFDCETGPRDVVEDSFNGYLVNCFDIDGFCTRLDHLCDDEVTRKTFSDNSKHIARKYQVGEIVPKWNALFCE